MASGHRHGDAHWQAGVFQPDAIAKTGATFKSLADSRADTTTCTAG